MRITLLLTFIILTNCPNLNADSVYYPDPQPYVLASSHGPYYVTMMPIGANDGYGIAYELLHDGSSTELWRVNKYFNRYFGSAYLSGDGQHLVRVSSGMRGGHGPFQEVAIEFYKSGVLFKTLSIEDLVKDTSKIEHTVSHYIWMRHSSDYPKLISNTKLFLKTIDGIRYWFDPTSGEIIETNFP